MSLRFILGRVGYDHFAKLISLMKRDYRRKPHDHYFYLVPNHIKFRSEIETLNRLSQGRDPYAQINVQILSLTRMGWYFFNQEPLKQHQQISDSGVNMLLYAIIQRHESELTLFHTEAQQSGFILKIAQEISEMQTAQISADDLDRLYQKATGWDEDLIQKTHDFIIIYRAFEKATRGKYISKPGILNRLCDDLSHRDLSGDHFYISGFAQFTAQENRLVKILIQRSANVVIDLNLDRPYANRKPKHPDLFYRPAVLYNRLYYFARVNHVPVLPDLTVDQPRVSSDLLKLEAYWIDSHRLGPIKPSKFKNSRSVQIIQADNHYSELAQVAVRIRQMVESGKYRYSDFLILTRHLDKFSNVIKPIFQLQHVPIFDDLQKQMVSHPLVRLIEALFSIYDPDSKRNYQYRDVMGLLKTELLIPQGSDGQPMPIADYRRDLALCENLVLRNGYQGSSWLQKKDWRYSRYNDITHKLVTNAELTKRINVIRHFVRDTLPPFYHELAKADTGREAAQVLYSFLVNHGVVTRLKTWRQNEKNAGHLDYAGQNNQIWGVFCNLLDNFVEILGDKPFKLADFWALLKAGFEATSYSQVPPTFDQVVISESKIVQMKDYKVVFMIGSTDDVMPDHIVNDSLFNDTDRDYMKAPLKQLNGSQPDRRYLNDGSENQMANEPYLNYLAFMSATQKIIFTYSLGGDDNVDTGIKVSPYVAQIQRHFRIPVQQPTATPRADQNDVRPYLGSQRATLRHLVQAIYDVRDHPYSLSPAWRYIERLLAASPQAALEKRLLDSVHYQNVPRRLAPDYAAELYGDRIDVSISQLEAFYDDPYEYFLKYGLKLQPRSVFELSPASTGLFYHESLDHLMKYLKIHQLDIATVDPISLDHIVDGVTDRILSDPKETQYTILKSSARMHYIRTQLVRTVKEMAATIHLQAHYTPMRPKRTEVPFSPLKRHEFQLKPLSFVLKPKRDRHEHRLSVQGRIDRIDAMQTKDRSYFGIVDYKSSYHSFDFGQIYAGTQMQMLTYLDVLYHNLGALSPNEQSRLSGALYSLIQDPTLKPKDVQHRTVQSAVLNHQKYNGILVNDPDFLNHVDRNLTQHHKSVLYPLRESKSGRVYKNDQRYLVTPKDLKLMLQWTEHLIRHAGNLIYDGVDSLRPVQFNNQRTLLKYSPYRPIMEFDPLLPKNRYRKITSIKEPAGLVMKLKSLINDRKGK